MTTAVEGHLPAGLPLSDARLRVLDAAVGLFGERGFHGVSMRDLAEALGMKGASLYAHVTSKQHLLFEILRIGYAEHCTGLAAALLDVEDEPAAQMRALMRAHVLMPLRFPALTRTCNLELRHLDEALLAEILELRARSAAVFLDVVDRGVRSGTFTVTNPRRAMRALADMGIRTAEWPRPEGTDEQIAADYGDYALRVLA